MMMMMMMDVTHLLTMPHAAGKKSLLHSCTYLSSIRTNERLRSRTVKIDVSTLATPERCLPTFKVALVICQEDYDISQDFDPLKAPKNDGTSLVTALKEMDFQVFAFANITLEEMRNAVEMFASFIDGKTQDPFLFLPFPLR